MRMLMLIIVAFFMPTTNYAASQWLKDSIEAKEQGMMSKPIQRTQKAANKGFFGQHGFIFFYGSTCPHCQQFAPILKAWADNHQAQILPLSFDNQPLASFQQFLPATTEWINAAFGSNPINYPALFILNAKTKALYPVSFGAMSAYELEERMQALIPKVLAYEAKGGLQ